MYCDYQNVTLCELIQICEGKEIHILNNYGVYVEKTRTQILQSELYSGAETFNCRVISYFAFVDPQYKIKKPALFERCKSFALFIQSQFKKNQNGNKKTTAKKDN